MTPNGRELSFSPRQRQALTWWMDENRAKAGVICEGAVRSGKTFAMTLSFFLWATTEFSGERFALCGRSVNGVRRNVVTPILPLLRRLGFRVSEKLSDHTLRVGAGGRENLFYLFGGANGASAGVIQGMTLAGVLLDEAALMPQDFVNQACARCSVTGARLWFNCNPDSPEHPFYRQWVAQAEEKNLLRLHFTMDDNPALSEQVKARYRRMYSGVFYRRYVEGEWTRAEGLVYPFFDRSMTAGAPQTFDESVISCDYGTVNPFSLGLWRRSGGVWYRTDEYYYDSRAEGRMKTDEDYYTDLVRLAGDLPVSALIIDPSAASFAQCVRQKGRFPVIKANNNVSDGIRLTARALKEGRIVICPGCKALLREISLYRWSDKPGAEIPVKENDHAMDEMRYFVATKLYRAPAAFAAAAVRRGPGIGD